MDPDAFADSLDTQGANSAVSVRIPQVRYSFGLGGGASAYISAEVPSTSANFSIAGTPATPTTAFSMGCVTRSSTCCGARPGASVGMTTSGGENSPTTLYYGVRNTIAVCERWAPLGTFGTWRRRSILLAAHVAQAAMSRRKREGLAAVWQGWRDVRAGRFGQRRT